MPSHLAKMELRDYQQDAVQAVLLSLDKSVNPLLVAPTGAGKTVMAAKIMSDWQDKNAKPVYFFAHRRELLEQAQATLDRFGVHGKALSVFAKQYDDIPQDQRDGALCVFDEAHHAVASSWRNVEWWFNGPKVAITATPDRLDRQCLSAAGFTLVHEIQIRKLIKDGHLVRPMAQKLALSISDQTLDAYDEIVEQLAKNVVDEFLRFGRRKAMVFLPSVDSSLKFSIALRKLGFEACHVDGTGTAFLRNHLVDGFKNGDIQFLCSVALFTEGFDCPEVDCVVLLRETKSRALWSQMIGRGLRTFPGKTDCLILDPLWVSGTHSLTAADAFTTHEDAVCKPVLGLSDPLNEAEIQDQVAEDAFLSKLKKLERKKMDKEAKEKGLIDLSAVSPILGIVPPPAEDGDDLLNTMQKAALAMHKVYAPELTWRQADFVLEKLGERLRLGLASVKQVKRLRQFGHRSAHMYTFDQANKAISTDWRINPKAKYRFRKTFN